MVLRPYQYYAVEKIIERVNNSTKNGYIWHTTGAGKTLTSFKAAQLVAELPEVDKVMLLLTATTSTRRPRKNMKPLRKER